MLPFAQGVHSGKLVAVGITALLISFCLSSNGVSLSLRCRMPLCLPEYLWRIVLAFYGRCPDCDERRALLVLCDDGTFVMLCIPCFGVYMASLAEG